MNRRINRLVCGLASAMIAGASFAAFPVSAAQVETRTLSYAETAALFGFTKFQTVQSAGLQVISYVYPETGGYTQTYNPYGWWTNYEINGVPYIGVRIYGYTGDWSASKTAGNLQISMRSSMTLDNLYDFTVGAGYMGNAWMANTGGGGTSNLWLEYYENGVQQRIQGGALFSASAVNVDTQSLTAVYITQDAVYSPATATAPIYDLYTINDSSDWTNFTLNVYGITSLARPETVNGVEYSAYTYLLIRCPTITSDVDSLAQIDSKLDGVASSLQGILDSLTPSVDIAPAVSSVATQVSADASAVSSAIGEEHDFLHSFQYSGFPEGYDPTYSDDAVGLFAILFRFWENNQYVITVSAGAMALALVSYILYGRKF